MRFDVITAFPDMMTEALKWGVVGRSQEKGIFQFNAINPRDFTTDAHKTIDDRPFGGGDGMVMLFEPLSRSLESIQDYKNAKKIYLSPSGKLLNESLVTDLSKSKNFIFLCGRYGGVDQRFLNTYEFESISVGDYVVSGGELPALMLMDAILRKIPGVLGNTESAGSDSFAKNPFFEAPLFTRPREHASGAVPEVLLSGDHKKIEEFRFLVGLALTLQNRPGFLTPANEDKKRLKKFFSQTSLEDLNILGFTESFIKQWN